MTTNQQLLDFITQARKRGFSDSQIKNSLIEHNWLVRVIDKAFESLMPKFKSKNQVCIFLSDDILKVLEKRAKKNLQTISEQIEEIIRKSCVTYKGKKQESEKLDDMFISYFSRKR